LNSIKFIDSPFTANDADPSCVQYQNPVIDSRSSQDVPAATSNQTFRSNEIHNVFVPVFRRET
jgi:hypothetical protein